MSPCTNLKDQAACLTRCNLAKAAILATAKEAAVWSDSYMQEQAELIVANTLDARAGDATCVASILYGNLVALLPA